MKVASKSIEQLSDSSETSPVTVRSVASTSHSIVISTGTVNVGAVTSCTVITCSSVSAFPQLSTNVHFLVIIYELGQSPSMIISLYVASKLISQLSASSETSPVTVRSVASTSHSIVISTGTVNVGAVTSCTVITCSSVSAFPQLSTNVHFLVIIYELGQSPSMIISLYVASKLISQLSASSKTSPVIDKSFASTLHSIVKSSGAVNVGAVVSTTLIV